MGAALGAGRSRHGPWAAYGLVGVIASVGGGSTGPARGRSPGRGL